MRNVFLLKNVSQELPAITVSSLISIQTHAMNARSCVRKICKQNKKCVRNAINARKLRKQKTLRTSFKRNERKHQPIGMVNQSNQSSKQPIKRLRKFRCLRFSFTQCTHCTQCKRLRCVRLHGNRASHICWNLKNSVALRFLQSQRWLTCISGWVCKNTINLYENT